MPAEELQRQIARNESIFREVNEAIQSGHWPGEEDHPAAFRCECGQLGCTRLIEMSVAEYEEVREHPRRFILAPHHERRELEDVVAERPGYIVVEKRGEAGRLAEEYDPRS
jgi:hypothetical protein